MATDNTFTSNFIDSDGSDLGKKYITKSYLMEIYPYLQNVGISAPGLWVWGHNGTGAVGDNTTTERHSPTQTVSGGTNWKQVSTDSYRTAAIKIDGTLWNWGSNTSGELGDSTRTNRSSPVQTISGGTNWKQVACGYYHTIAIKTDGTLWNWGRNNYGQLGDSTRTDRSSPVQTISGGTNWKCVASCVNDNHAAAIKTDGTLWLWGYNAYGQLGNSNTNNVSSPIQTIAGGTNWKQVAIGYMRTIAIKTDGTLWGWGYDSDGQLGRSIISSVSSPVQTICGGTNWEQVSCAIYHTAAVKTDGSLWLWGRNTYGMLGTNSTTDRSSPIQTICAGTNWKHVVCGYYHTAAIKTDGTLWTWGYNLYGQLGNSDTNYVYSPIQTIAGGNNWKQIDSGEFNIAAISEMGGDF